MISVLKARGSEATSMVQRLLTAGLTAQDISDALGGRVTRRTIYRWQKGDTAPQRQVDMDALRALVTEKCPPTS